MRSINKKTYHEVRQLMLDVRTNILTQQARNEQALEKIEAFLKSMNWDTFNFEYPPYNGAKTYKQKIVAVMREMNRPVLISEVVEEINKRDENNLVQTDISPIVTLLVKEGIVFQTNKKEGRSFYFELI